MIDCQPEKSFISAVANFTVLTIAVMAITGFAFAQDTTKPSDSTIEYSHDPSALIVANAMNSGEGASQATVNSTQSDKVGKQVSSAPTALNGWFDIIWGDSATGLSSETRYHLTDENGKITTLLLDQSLIQSIGGVLSLNRKYVNVEGSLATTFADSSAPEVLRVSFISLSAVTNKGTLAEEFLPLVSGSKPWVSIMCKFSDYDDEPNDLAFFQGMYSSTFPGLDHYWREQSYDTVNIVGSTASGWFVLPHSEAYYNPTDTPQGTNLTLLAQDCINAANPSINFALYSGINMMFNTNFDNGVAWGGSRYMTLDGVTRYWSTTWEPPWAYSNIAVIAHEMGHGFGLPHSSGDYGQTYDNEWDVMSDTWANCNRSSDATYGCMGQHTISYHKDLLGWIEGAEKYIAGPGTDVVLTLERLALPGTGNYTMLQIPISGSSTHFYTVEARRQNSYDYKLPGEGVIIHEVDTTRSRPAYVIDSDGNGDTGDAGAIWSVGETFSDATIQLSVSVLSGTSTGFQVNLRVAPIAQDCYALTLSHDGSGSNPMATADNSSGCASGNYHAGEVIGLNTSPDSGWNISGWVGTDSDASTSISNQLTMPASVHVVNVSYEPDEDIMFGDGFEQ